MILFITFFYVFLYGTAENQSELTLVTAFYEIDKGRISDGFHYLTYFEKWAQMNNFLYVFCPNESVKTEVLNVRKNYGLEKKTVVIVIDNIYSLEKVRYKKMVDLAKHYAFKNFRVKKNVSENIPEFNYIGYLRGYFLDKVNSDYNITTDSLAWIDFKFNGLENGTCSLKRNWNLTLTYKTPDKVTIFSPTPSIDERPIFEIIRTGVFTSLIDSFFIVPKKQVVAFWEVEKRAWDKLLYMGLMDRFSVVLLLCRKDRVILNPLDIESTSTLDIFKCEY